VGGCAAVTTSEITDNTIVPKGLVYYLPTQQLILKLTVGDDNRTVTVDTSTIVADTSHRFIARYQRNAVGATKTNILINTNGLLSGQGSGETVGGLTDILKAIAADAGAIRSGGFELQLASMSGVPPKEDTANACAKKGVYSWEFDPYDINQSTLDAWRSCQIDSVVAVQLDGKPLLSRQSERLLPDNSAGYYYRQALPVLIKVSDQKKPLLFYRSIVSAHSPTEFLPIPTAAFSDAKWNITFDNGMPTAYNPDAGSELTGLLTAPTSVIESYTTALTAGITRRGSNRQAIDKKEAQDAQHSLCMAAVAGGDMVKIKSACVY
jgi:hypothetical protein